MLPNDILIKIFAEFDPREVFKLMPHLLLLRKYWHVIDRQIMEENNITADGTTHICRLRRFPVCDFKNLTTLCMNSLNLSRFPNVRLSNLQSANFSKNNFVELPASLIGIKTLRLLNFSHNKLVRLPRRGLATIQRLRLSNNLLTAADCDFAGFDADLSHNFLRRLPKIRTAIIDVRHNLITVLDCRGTTMRSITANHNLIHTVIVPPKKMSLSLRSNLITEVPPRKYGTLNVSNNPIRQLTNVDADSLFISRGVIMDNCHYEDIIFVANKDK